jgi:formylglycine-generating enzyme required for sulfatase activity
MGYLIPYDARVDLSKQPNPAQYLLYCIGMDELHRTAQNIKAKHLLFIVDACYSGLVLSSSKGLDHSAHGYLVKVARARTEQMITAGGQGEESAESSEWGHGAFTYKLIESLQDGIADSDDDGVVMGSELGTHLRTTVLQLTEGEQTPQFRMQGEGEFLFFLDSGRSNEVTSIISKEKPPFQPNGKWRVTARNIILGFVPVLLVAIMLNRLKRRNPARGSAIGIIMLLVATLNRLKQRKKGHVDPRDPTHPETFTGNDGAPMVLIPEGEFLMGSDEGDPCERPVHAVCLNPFYMDVYEVTNGQYARFLNEYGKHTDLNGNRFLDVDNDYCLIEKEGDTYRPREDYEKHPVIYVSWYGAKAYAEHYGKRLPTEAEWEKAARGGLAGEKYPWGEGFDPAKANYNQGQEEEDVLEALKPVGQSPPNGYGLYDMAGNVLEWCANEYIGGFEGYLDDTYGSGAEPLFCDKKERVVRGGSWSSPDPQYLRVAYRYKVMEGECDGSIGFRCVQDSRGGS